MRHVSLHAVAIAVAALEAAGAPAASDCFEPLRANAGWRCHADVPGGTAVDYCLEHTHAFGTDPASRFFKLIATGPYPGHCSCRAKGKPPGAAFGEDRSYLCLHRDTDSVVSCKIAKRRMTGETFSAAYNLELPRFRGQVSAFEARPFLTPLVLLGDRGCGGGAPALPVSPAPLELVR